MENKLITNDDALKYLNTKNLRGKVKVFKEFFVDNENAEENYKRIFKFGYENRIKDSVRLNEEVGKTLLGMTFGSLLNRYISQNKDQLFESVDPTYGIKTSEKENILKNMPTRNKGVANKVFEAYKNKDCIEDKIPVGDYFSNVTDLNKALRENDNKYLDQRYKAIVDFLTTQSKKVESYKPNVGGIKQTDDIVTLKDKLEKAVGKKESENQLLELIQDPKKYFSKLEENIGKLDLVYFSDEKNISFLLPVSYTFFNKDKQEKNLGSVLVNEVIIALDEQNCNYESSSDFEGLAQLNFYNRNADLSKVYSGINKAVKKEYSGIEDIGLVDPTILEEI